MIRHRIIVLSETAEWRRLLPGATALVRRAAKAALAAAGPAQTAELDIVLVDDARQRELNRDWRGQDKSTNVLSFPCATELPRAANGASTFGSGMPLLLGDVVLAAGTIAAEAESQGKSLADHVTHLVIHGVLHLLGYDHEDGRSARRMEGLEVTLLETLGIADPYRPVPATPQRKAARKPAVPRVASRRPASRKSTSRRVSARAVAR